MASEVRAQSPIQAAPGSVHVWIGQATSPPGAVPAMQYEPGEHALMRHASPEPLSDAAHSAAPAWQTTNVAGGAGDARAASREVSASHAARLREHTGQRGEDDEHHRMSTIR